MFKVPSLQKAYTLVFSQDPALNLPKVPAERADETAAESAERKRLADERARLLRIARENGTWSDILIVGETPTLWTMRSLLEELTFLQGEARRNHLTVTELAELCFRYALVDVANLDGLKLQHTLDEAGRKLLHHETVAAIKRIGCDAGMPRLGHDLILELGALAMDRAQNGGGVTGKS